MKVAKEEYMQSGNGFRFSWLAAFGGLMLLWGLLSAPASATTITFARSNGSETIANASTATWAENSETLQFSVTGASDYYRSNCVVDGLLGVAGGNDCVGVDEWALASSVNGVQVFSATVSITGKVFDLSSLAITSWAGPANGLVDQIQSRMVAPQPAGRA